MHRVRQRGVKASDAAELFLVEWQFYIRINYFEIFVVKWEIMGIMNDHIRWLKPSRELLVSNQGMFSLLVEKSPTLRKA